MNSPTVIHGPPSIASGSRFSGGRRDVAKAGLGASVRIALCTRGRYHFLLKRMMIRTARMTPTPTPRKVRPVERLVKE